MLTSSTVFLQIFPSQSHSLHALNDFSSNEQTIFFKTRHLKIFQLTSASNVSELKTIARHVPDDRQQQSNYPNLQKINISRPMYLMASYRVRIKFDLGVGRVVHDKISSALFAVKKREKLQIKMVAFSSSHMLQNSGNKLYIHIQNFFQNMG